jgi:hypothetical protein
MDTNGVNDEHDELTDADDDVPEESTDDEVDYRERAAAEIDQIARLTKQALIDADIDLGIFFVIPSSGPVILTFGTITDPPDDQWHRAGEIVGSIVAQSIGLIRVRRREVTCVTTRDQA